MSVHCKYLPTAGPWVVLPGNNKYLDGQVCEANNKRMLYWGKCGEIVFRNMTFKKTSKHHE